MDPYRITYQMLVHPPEWLIDVVAYLKHHAKEERITPAQLARRWEAKIGRSRKQRIVIAQAILRREIETFKDLSQGEINALTELCRWIDEDCCADEGDAPRWHVGRGPQGAAHP